MKSRSSTPVRLFVGCLVLFALLLAAAPAYAIDHDRLRQFLLEDGPPEWGGVFNELQKEPPESQPGHYAAVLGRVFTDADLTKEKPPEEKRRLFAALIVHLVKDQPGEDGVVLLVGSFLPHLAADPKLREELRTGNSFIKDLNSGRRPMWDRLVNAVLDTLGEASPAVRASAMRVAAESVRPQEERGGVARIVARLHQAKKAVGGRWEGSDAAALLDAFEILLRHRFPDAAAIDTFLVPFAHRLERVDTWTPMVSAQVRADLHDAVSALKVAESDQGGEKQREGAINFGRAVIAAAKRPGDLQLFFPAEGEIFVELQREAVEKAAQMKPGPEPGPDDPAGAWPAWAAFHVAALSNSTDGQVLRAVIGLIAETFTKPLSKTDSQQVAAAVARRLRDGAKTDAIGDRVNLANNIVGRIGTILDVREALPATVQNGNGDKQAPVYGALIEAIGLVQDGVIEMLLPYLLKSGGTEQPEWARVAVAKALGYTGFTRDEAEAPRAALLLTYILTGDAVKHTNADGGVFEVPAGEPDASPAVRAEAIGSLANYPGPASAKTLETLAKEEGAEADLALRQLGRQLKRGSPDAAGALANLIGAAPSEARLLVLLDHVAKGVTDDLASATRASLGAAIRGLLGPGDASDAVRRKAAEVAAKLRDVDSIPRLIALWKPDLKAAAVVEAWRKPLEALIVAVAATPRADDTLYGKIVDALATVDNHPDVLAFYAAMGQTANTQFALKRGRADVHYTYSSALESTDIDAARAQLDETLRLWKGLIVQAPSNAIRNDIYRGQFPALTKRAAPPWLKQGEDPIEFLLDAVYAATQSKSEEDLKVARTTIVPRLDDLSLSETQKARLDAMKEQLPK